MVALVRFRFKRQGLKDVREMDGDEGTYGFMISSSASSVFTIKSVVLSFEKTGFSVE